MEKIFLKLLHFHYMAILAASWSWPTDPGAMTSQLYVRQRSSWTSEPCIKFFSDMKDGREEDIWNIALFGFCLPWVVHHTFHNLYPSCNNLSCNFYKEALCKIVNGRCAMHDDERRPMTIGHLTDSRPVT